MGILLLTTEKGDWLQPAVVAAIIGALVSLPGFILNYQTHRQEQKKAKRDEIYKKLNDFYGPIRLQLKTSKELYALLVQV